MRSLEQIIADNGGDNTPALDTHNLTGRAFTPYEPDWTPYDVDWDDPDEYADETDMPLMYSYETWLGRLDCE